MEEDYQQRLKKLFVGGLHRETSGETIKEYFGRYGELEDCVVITDSSSGGSRGFGYVTFVDYRCTFPVLQDKKESGHMIDKKEVDVKRAIPRDDSSPASHSRTKKIFIGGVKRDAEEKEIREELEKILESYGTVESIDMIRDKDSGEFRGFGFVELDCEDTADTLCCVKKINIKGKIAEVKKAEDKKKEGGSSRGRGRGRGGSSRGGGQGSGYGMNSGGMGYSGGMGQNPSGFSSGMGDQLWYGAGGASSPFGAYGGNTAFGGYNTMGMFGQMGTSFGPQRTGFGSYGGDSMTDTSATRSFGGGRGNMNRYKPY